LPDSATLRRLPPYGFSPLPASAGPVNASSPFVTPLRDITPSGSGPCSSHSPCEERTRPNGKLALKLAATDHSISLRSPTALFLGCAAGSTFQARCDPFGFAVPRSMTLRGCPLASVLSDDSRVDFPARDTLRRPKPIHRSSAPWDSLPTHRCRFPVRAHTVLHASLFLEAWGQPVTPQPKLWSLELLGVEWPCVFIQQNPPTLRTIISIRWLLLFCCSCEH
jgi:hypothetical protein